jgi:hypothetical protein
MYRDDTEQELEAIQTRIAELRQLEPTPALEAEADQIEARLVDLSAFAERMREARASLN